MKNFKNKFIFSVFTILLHFSLSCIAQNPNYPVTYNEDYRQKINHVFANMPLHQVPSGLLADYGMSFANLSHYTGTPTDSSYVTMQVIRRIYATLLSAKVGGAYIHTLADFNEQVQRETEYYDNGKDSVALVALAYQYHRLKPTAIQEGLLAAQSGQLYPLSTQSSLYYESQVLFACSPTVNIFRTQHIRVSLPEIVWSNIESYNNTFSIDFGDGQGFKSLQLTQGQSVYYPTAGLKTITVKFTTDTGSPHSATYTSQSHIWIQPAASSPVVASRNSAITERLPVNPNQEIQVVATRPHLGTLGRATLQIGLSDDGIFDHPLIVVEGFDASRWLPIGDYNYNTFIRQGLRFGVNDVFLDDALSSTRNYDIVFVNFADGTDHIQRNAYVVQEAIRWVNRNKVNNPATGQREPNVVLGMSMGGLVARYALAEMERPTDGRTSENHEVCQYYSHDTPHEGAYAPVAGVAALIHASTLGVGVGVPHLVSVGIPFKDMIPELQGVLNMAYSPAARQMAKESVQLWSSQLVHTVSTEHQAFMNEYNALGYPTRCRNFAIANGGTQGAGSTSQIAPYAEMVRITGNAMDNFGLVSPILGAFAFFQIDSYASINWAALASFIPLGSSGLETEVILNALPQRQVRRVYSLRITQVKNIMWLIPVRSDLTNNRMDSRPNCVAWENAPGGQYQIPIATNPANINLNNWFVSVNNNVNLNINRFAFVPTLSSIDFGGTAAGNHENIYDVIPNTNGIVTSNIGFISAYTPQNNNEVHIAFNRPNANWWLPQLDAGCTTVNCNGLDQISIRGRNILCTNTTETYTIDLPTGATAQWTVSPSNLVNLTVVSSNIIRLTPIDATSRGWLTVSVEVSSNACNFQRTFSQEIWVGEMSPITTIDNNPLYDGCLTFQETFALLANEAQAATSIRWFVTRNNMSEVEVISAANQRRWNTAIRVLPGDTEKLTIRVVADNGCSQSSYTDVFEYSLPAGRPRCNPPVGGRTLEPLLKLYPNPTALLLNITIENLNSPIEQVVVRNSIGTVVLQTNSLNFTDDKTAVLSLDTLPEGIYFLTVTLQDGQQLSQKVVVQRSGVAN